MRFPTIPCLLTVWLYYCAYYANAQTTSGSFSRGSLVKTFIGHTYCVEFVTIVNSYLYSAGDDYTVRKWSTVNGSNVLTYNATFSIWMAEVDSVNGYLYGGASIGNQSIQWSLANGTLLQRFIGPKLSVQYVKIYSNYLYSGSWDALIYKYSSNSSTALKVLAGHTSAVSAMQLILTGGNEIGYLYSASLDSSIRQWALVNDSFTQMFTGTPSTIRALLIYGTSMFSGGQDNAIRQWNPYYASSALQIFKGHTGGVFGLSACNEYLFSSSLDTTVRQWWIANVSTIYTYQGFTTGYVLSVFAMQDYSMLFIASYDFNIYQFSMYTMTTTTTTSTSSSTTSSTSSTSSASSSSSSSSTSTATTTTSSSSTSSSTSTSSTSTSSSTETSSTTTSSTTSSTETSTSSTTTETSSTTTSSTTSSTETSTSSTTTETSSTTTSSTTSSTETTSTSSTTTETSSTTTSSTTSSTETSTSSTTTETSSTTTSSTETTSTSCTTTETSSTTTSSTTSSTETSTSSTTTETSSTTTSSTTSSTETSTSSTTTETSSTTTSSTTSSTETTSTSSTTTETSSTTTSSTTSSTETSTSSTTTETSSTTTSSTTSSTETSTSSTTTETSSTTTSSTTSSTETTSTSSTTTETSSTTTSSETSSMSTATSIDTTTSTYNTDTSTSTSTNSDILTTESIEGPLSTAKSMNMPSTSTSQASIATPSGLANVFESCANTSCDMGLVCDSMFQWCTTNCRSDLECLSQYTCDSGLCRDPSIILKTVGFNESCSSYHICGMGLTCESGTCLYAAYNYGDVCDDTTICTSGGNTLHCVSGICLVEYFVPVTFSATDWTTSTFSASMTVQAVTHTSPVAQNAASPTTDSSGASPTTETSLNLEPTLMVTSMSDQLVTSSTTRTTMLEVNSSDNSTESLTPTASPSQTYRLSTTVVSETTDSASFLAISSVSEFSMSESTAKSADPSSATDALIMNELSPTSSLTSLPTVVILTSKDVTSSAKGNSPTESFTLLTGVASTESWAMMANPTSLMLSTPTLVPSTTSMENATAILSPSSTDSSSTSINNSTQASSDYATSIATSFPSMVILSPKTANLDAFSTSTTTSITLITSMSSSSPSNLTTSTFSSSSSSSSSSFSSTSTSSSSISSSSTSISTSTATSTSTSADTSALTSTVSSVAVDISAFLTLTSVPASVSDSTNLLKTTSSQSEFNSVNSPLASWVNPVPGTVPQLLTSPSSITSADDILIPSTSKSWVSSETPSSLANFFESCASTACLAGLVCDAMFQHCTTNCRYDTDCLAQYTCNAGMCRDLSSSQKQSTTTSSTSATATEGGGYGGGGTTNSSSTASWIPIVAGVGGSLLGLGGAVAAAFYMRRRKRDRDEIKTLPDDVQGASKPANPFVQNVVESTSRFKSAVVPLQQIPSINGAGIVPIRPIQKAGALEPIVSASPSGLSPLPNRDISAIPSVMAKRKVRVRAKKLSTISPTSGEETNTPEPSQIPSGMGEITASPDHQSFTSPNVNTFSSEDSPSNLPVIGSVAAVKKKRVRTKKPYITDPEGEIEKKEAEATMQEVQSVRAKMLQDQQDTSPSKSKNGSVNNSRTKLANVALASGHLPEEGMVGYGELFRHRRSVTARTIAAIKIDNDLEAQDVDEASEKSP